MIEVDEQLWTEADVAWQRDGSVYRFLVPGRSEAPMARVKTDRAGEAVLSPGGLPVLDLQPERLSSHAALLSYLEAALAA